MSLHKAIEDDIPRIRALAIPIFTESFKEILSPEQNKYMLNWMYSAEQLKQELERGVSYYILVVDGEDIGYTALEEVSPSAKLYKLHKIYLAHSMHGKGLGKLQISAMERIARESGGHTIKLNVNRSNKAVKFYESQGWRITGSVDNNIGDGFYMNDYVLEKSLQ